MTLPEWLFDFQREDVKKLAPLASILNACEMGTGKTYEAIALDLVRRANDHSWETKKITLVVAPLSTLYATWAEHFEELAPELTICVIDPKVRGKFTQALRNQEADVYIMHWEALRLIPELKQQIFFHVIADEVHRAKNRKAQQTVALKKVRTKYKTGLSGTPVTNKPNDLWSILNWLYRSQFGSYWRFFEEYVSYEIQYPHGYRKILGPKNEGTLLAIMRPFYVRHLKKSRCCEHHPNGVMEDLPDKYYSKIWVELDPKQRRAYDEMKKDMIAWLEDEDRPLVAPVVVAQLIRLQQLASAYVTFSSETQHTTVELTEPSSKLDALMQILEDNPDESIVIFSQFKQVINLLRKRLEKSGIEYVQITGDVSPTNRQRAVRDFQAGSVKVFLGTIAAGGEGITLTEASTVVFLDRDWSPAKNQQAEDRLHRHGQKNAVHVIDIMAQNTVDLGRHTQLEMKKDWIRRLLGDL